MTKKHAQVKKQQPRNMAEAVDNATEKAAEAEAEAKAEAAKPDLKLHDEATAESEQSDELPLTPLCPVGGVRCKRGSIDGAGNTFCQITDKKNIRVSGVYDNCPWSKHVILAKTILVCRKHGEGVEALAITGSAVSGQYCVHCLMELLGGFISPLTIKEIADESDETAAGPVG